MISQKPLINGLVGLLLLMTLQAYAQAQTQLNSCTDANATKDFYALGTRTGELNSEIRQAEKELQELQSKLPEAIPA